MHREKVLTIPEAHFAYCYFNGFRWHTEDYAKALLDVKKMQWVDRDKAESDPKFKQLVAYVIIHRKDKIFNYVRTSTSNESRLHAKRSIGVGGHISYGDLHQPNIVLAAAKREVAEEVNIQGKVAGWHPLGYIYDPRNAVGRVHIGCVFTVEVNSTLVQPIEDKLGDTVFTPLEELIERRGEFEHWSDLIFDFLPAFLAVDE